MLVESKGTNISGKTTVFTIHLQEEGSRLVKKTGTFQPHLTGPVPEQSNFHSH